MYKPLSARVADRLAELKGKKPAPSTPLRGYQLTPNQVMKALRKLKRAGQ